METNKLLEAGAKAPQFTLPNAEGDPVSLADFAGKKVVPFLLLSDPELAAIQAYGVWQEKKNYGKVSMGVVRSTFIIDENGVIEKVMPKVKPDTNAAEVLAYLKGDK